MSNASDSPSNAFHDRSAEEQEAILLNLLCRTCHKLASGPIDPKEVIIDGEQWVVAKCAKCGNLSSIRVADVP